MKLSIVIPAHNEEEGIGPTLNTIPVKALEAAGYEVEMVVVDNASTDKTAEIARKHGARVVYEPLKGYGYAYRAGFEHAAGDIIATGDADMTYPLGSLPKILATMHKDNLDFVSTDRLTNLRPGVMQGTHIFGNRVLTLIMRLLFRAPFRDSQSGMWVFRSSIWPYLDVKHYGMPFSQEIKIEAFRRGYNCGEVTIDYHSRIGEAKMSIVDAWHVIYELIKKRFSIKRVHPELSVEELE